jgi:hypothetical protein
MRYLHEAFGAAFRQWYSFYMTENEPFISPNSTRLFVSFDNLARASSLRLLLRAAIFVLRIYEAPNLIALDFLRREIAKDFVLILGANAAKIAQQFHDRCAMDAGHASDRTQRVAFNQSSHDLLPLFCAQFVHALICLSGQALSNRKVKFFENVCKKDSVDVKPSTVSYLLERQRKRRRVRGLNPRNVVTATLTCDYKSRAFSARPPLLKFLSQKMKADDVTASSASFIRQNISCILLVFSCCQKGFTYEPPFPPAYRLKQFLLPA